MTDDVTSDTKQKKIPDLHVFEKQANGDLTYLGAAFLRKKGDGYDVVSGEKRYIALPPKKKNSTTSMEGA